MWEVMGAKAGMADDLSDIATPSEEVLTSNEGLSYFQDIYLNIWKHYYPLIDKFMESLMQDCSQEVDLH